MAILTREQLKQYCLRKLGAPVINIEGDNQQWEDRIDDALKMFTDFHGDAVQTLYMKHKITASSMTFSLPITGAFVEGETITGSISNATATFIDSATNNLSLRFKTILGTFSNGETVTGQQSGATAHLSVTNAVTLGDIDNRYIPIDDSIIAIKRIFPFTGGSLGNDNYMFDIRYQMMLNSIVDLSYTDLKNYYILQQHLDLINFTFSGEETFEFNKFSNKLEIQWDWNNATVDQYLMIEASKVVDPEEFTRIYDDTWLQNYCTALFKLQWGNNLRKMNNISLLGGATLDAKSIEDEAKMEINELEKDLRSTYEKPVAFLVG